MIELDVGLQTLNETVFVVGHAYTVSPPVVTGAYPVTAEISALAVQVTASVLAVPLIVVVTVVAQAVDAIGLVPRVAVPLPIVTVQVAQAMVPVVVIVPPVMGDVVAMLVTVPVPFPTRSSRPVIGFTCSESADTNGEINAANTKNRHTNAPPRRIRMEGYS